MSVANPVLYIPVESQNRELDAKLLVAAEVASAGVKVVIGWQRAIVANLRSVPPGVVLLKGLNKIQCSHMRRAAVAGHHVVAIDEEGFAISEPECLLKDIDPDAARYCEVVYAPNQVYRRALIEHRGFRDEQILVAGNPRGDLARPPLNAMLRDEADALAEAYGPMVLVNSNTCAVNSVWGDLDRYFQVCAQIGWLDPDDPKGHKTFNDHVAHDQASFVALRAALESLQASLPDHNIVIRPHPSERFEPWYEKYAHRDRFHVVREGSNLAWIMAADLVLHTSCTTGAEAALMGRPAISLVPEGACVAHWYVSNQVNRMARTAAEVADLARRLLVHGEDAMAEGRAERERNLNAYFSLQATQSAYQRIARDILKRFGEGIDPSYQLRIESLRVVRESIAEGNKNEFGADAIQARLNLLERVSPGFQKPDIYQIHDEIFMLSTAASRGRR